MCNGVDLEGQFSQFVRNLIELLSTHNPSIVYQYCDITNLTPNLKGGRGEEHYNREECEILLYLIGCCINFLSLAAVHLEGMCYCTQSLHLFFNSIIPFLIDVP